MKNNSIQLIVKVTKFLSYGIMIQAFCFNALMALESNAQQIKSVKETKVEMRVSDVTVKDIFQYIEGKTNYKFFYDDEILDQRVKLSFNKRSILVSDVLLEMSRSAGLKFKQINNVINVSRNLNNSSDNHEAIEVVIQTRNITGRITSQEDGEPLPGANVVEKGSSRGTITDVMGNYTLDVSEGAVLVFSMVGYTSEEIPIGTRSVINLVMVPDIQQLQELVVVGYGAVQKRDLTGSVSSVSSRDVERVPVLGLDHALQGRAAGVFVENSNANPGGAVNIRIRGTNSIQGDNEPLYIVDGFIGGNINTVNPSDIQSIEILKDASATAIYGSRGANGVIIVTTKRGQRGQSNFNFDSFYGFQNRSRKIDVMGARDYANFVNAIDTDQGNPLTYPNIDNLQYDTDWQDMIYRTAPWQQYNLSASGGADNISYYISGGYTDQQGIMRETGFNRFNVRANIDGNLGNRINVGGRLGYTRSDRTLIGGEDIRNVDSDANAVVSRSITLQPTETPYDEFGDLRQIVVDYGGQTRAVPLFELQNIHQQRLENSINGNFFVEVQLLKPLKFRSTYGFDLLNRKDNIYNPSTVWTTTGGFQNSARINTRNNIMWLNENYFTFDQGLGNHKLQLIAGSTLQGFDREDVGVSATGFAIDDFLYHNIAAAANINPPSSYMEQWRQAAFFGRAHFDFFNKYLFTFNGRYDGKSIFGRANKWGFFPSGAFAWRISEEDFLQGSTLFNDVKLRASYGTSGSEAIRPYQTLDAFTPDNPAAIIGGETVVGYSPSQLPNPNLKWETTTQLNVGLDFSVLAGRLGFVVDYFYKTTNDLFLSQPVPRTTGLGSVMANIGSLRNSGVEFGLDAMVSRGNFTWDVNANGTLTYSEIKSLGDVDQIIFGLGGSSYSIMRVGEPLGTFYGYKTNGVWGTQDAELGQYTQFGQTVQPGDLKMVDVNGDGDVNADDRQIIGYAQPRFYGGLNNHFTLSGFDLSVFMQYVSGNSVYNRFAGNSYMNPLGKHNKHVDMNNYWRPDNQDTNIPRPGAFVPNDLFDIYLEEGSFVRLREISLGYSIPVGTIERIGISRLRLYVTGTNLLTFTNYRGYDPEVNYIAGSIRTPNMDNASYPRSRNLMFGINLGF